METVAVELLNGLLERCNGTFVGREVTNAIRRAKYPIVWRPLIERYVDLVVEAESGYTYPGPHALEGTLPTHTSVYCDMVCTVVTKKIMMVDIFYLYDPTPDENDEEKRLREVHMLTATTYLVRLLTCVYECVYGRLPDKVAISKAASLLYAEVYAEAFDVARVREGDIFRLVENWFRVHVLESETDRRFKNVAPGIPFLLCSHVYWLWLHLTAAKVRHSAQDLLTVVYALDMIVYCEDCKRHFLEHRSEFFYDDQNGGTNDCVCRLDNAELLFKLHNRVNAQCGTPQMDVTVLSDYRGFWEGRQRNIES